jgi:hypothetical protein
MSELKHKEATFISMAFMHAVSDELSQYGEFGEVIADTIINKAQDNFSQLNAGKTIPGTEYSQPQDPAGKGAKAMDKMIDKLLVQA